MEKIAFKLGNAGYILRSGGAHGADSAFEGGALLGAGRTDIYLPWRNFNGHQSPLYEVCDEALKMASQYHEVWNHLSQGAQKLHGRNCYQVLGKDLMTPSSCIICWTPDGANGTSIPTSKATGGTGQAIRLAVHHHIPVFNLQATPEEKMLENVRKVIAGDIILR